MPHAPGQRYGVPSGFAGAGSETAGALTGAARGRGGGAAGGRRMDGALSATRRQARTAPATAATANTATSRIPLTCAGMGRV